MRSFNNWWAKNYHREVYVLWISSHEFLNLICSLWKELFLCASSMIYWALLESIKFINSSILRDKRYEMSITSSLDTWNSFIDCLFVFILNLLRILEDFSPCLGIFSHGSFIKFVKEGCLCDDIWIFFFCIEDDMEKSDRSTCIDGMLLHIENIFWYFLWFQSLCLSIFELVLSWWLLIEHHDSQDWFRNHLQSPFFKRKQLLEREDLSFET